MSVVLDTSVVLAAMRADDAQHDAVRGWLLAVDDDLVTSPLALAEMDYLVTRAGGSSAAAALWASFEIGAYAVRWWADALAETVGLARRWERLGIGLADASLIAVAARLNTDRIATTDHRHFRQVTTVTGEPFVVLPADAPAP